MSLKVVLRNATDSKPLGNVYVQYAWDGQSKRFAVGARGLKVHKDGFEAGELVKCIGAEWKEHNATVKAGNAEIAVTVGALSKIVKRFVEDNGVAPSGEVLEELYLSNTGKLSGEARAEEKTFWKHLEAYQIELLAKVERKEARANTVRSLNPLFTLLREYEVAHGVRLTWSSFDYKMLDSLNEFIVGQGKRNSSIRTRFAKLKAVLNHFVKIGVCKHVAFREYRMKREQLSAPKGQRIIALSDAEFDEWMSLDLGGKKRLEYARDLFTLSCATGLRYSDVKRVGWQNVEAGCIEITTVKTREQLHIPLNAISRAILDKYPSGMKHIDNNDYNEDLRVIAGRCKSLQKQVAQITYSGQKEIEVIAPKAEFITSHVARKTFVTRCLLKGIPEFKIRKWTGHKDLSSFEKYIDTIVGQAEFMEKFN
ncbi:integrase catalytic domain-containing protein [Microvirga sp. STR05]|uniref:Integrase catalytic domain-containing protein n=1 Tax=Hymenobacter duratus TaxID=2771356 RepID=A0ABR8JM36_9BACT|nr:site-specific integrase [Hymenobacter duratus]MBD2716455.1 integrase catalytic domain-containing protein [Hymenobacter duratus]MBR7951370.1 integrase catalytic domain-containing protein [Microvirga sp. STR05]